MEFLNVLSREEMRNVKGGNGCTVYCCTGGPGTRSTGVSCPECSGTTNEECQSSAIDNGFGFKK